MALQPRRQLLSNQILHLQEYFLLSCISKTENALTKFVSLLTNKKLPPHEKSGKGGVRSLQTESFTSFLNLTPPPQSKSKELPNTSEEFVNKRTNQVMWGADQKVEEIKKKEKQN
jgi:hypothetical protein